MENQTPEHYELIKIESKIILTSDNQKNSWLLVGQYLYLVDKFELYKQNENHSSYTKWLHCIADKVNLKKSTLWKYKKIVTMINELKLTLEEVNVNNQNGLEQVARIYKLNKNRSEALKYINLLNDKNIKPVELTNLYKKLAKNKSDLVTGEKILPYKLSLSSKISNFINRILFTDNMLKTSSIMIVVFTITPIK
jgi:hypothetical protein